jgi:hypothetical protein
MPGCDVIGLGDMSFAPKRNVSAAAESDIN